MKDLKNLSNDVLLKELDSKVEHEKQSTAEVVAYVAEVFRRNLHLELGFSSLYKFISQRYKISEGSAYRRVSAAKLSIKHPEVIERLKNGELTLCAAAEAWKTFEAIRYENKKESLLPTFPPLTKKDERQILSELSHKTRTETRHLLAPHLPHALAPVLRAQIIPSPRIPEIMELRLPLTKEQELKFEKLKNILSHRIPNGDATELFDILLETALDKFDPARIQKRVEERRINAVFRRRTGPLRLQTNCEANETLDVESIQSTLKKPKIESVIEAKRKAWSKYDEGCAYTNPETGQRCASQWCLDVDHKNPKSKGGADTLENFQLLCRTHNRIFKGDRLMSVGL